MGFGDIAKNVANTTLKLGKLGTKGALAAGQAGYNKFETTKEHVKETQELQKKIKIIIDTATYRQQDAVSRLEAITEDVQDSLIELQKQQQHIIDYQETRFQRLYNYSLYSLNNSSSELTIAKQNFINKTTNVSNYNNTVNPAFGGIVAGATVAGIATSATALLGTAGTGAAIGGLHGAAAINATLAALGGGSIATGGFGIAGGLTVLGGLLVIPGIAAGGYIWDKNVRTAYQNALEYDEKTKNDVAKLKIITNNYKTAVKIIQTTIYETINLNGFLDGLLNVFESDLVYGANSESKDLCNEAMLITRKMLNLNFTANPQKGSISVLNQLHLLHNDLDHLKHNFGIYLSTLDKKHKEDAQHHVDIALKNFSDHLEKPPIIKVLRNEEIRYCLLNTFDWAQHDICIITPWISNWVCNEMMLAYFRRSMEKNVTIRIIYGIKNISRNHTSKQNNADRSLKTEEMALYLQKTFAKYGDLFRMQRQNTHAKLLICDDRYYVIGSYNFLSFDGDYTKDDVRNELADYSENKDMIFSYKKQFFDF